MALTRTATRPRKTNQDDTLNIDNVVSAAPLAIQTQVAPVTPTRDFMPNLPSAYNQDPSNPNKVRVNLGADTRVAPQTMGAPVLQNQGVTPSQSGLPNLPSAYNQDPSNPNKVRMNLAPDVMAPGAVQNPEAPVMPSAVDRIQGATTVDQFGNELATERATLESEVMALEKKISETPQATIDAQKRLGIYDDQKKLEQLRSSLSGIKDDLLTAVDQETVIREEGRQRISDFAGTSQDFGQLTNEDFRKNKLDQLTLSRSFSRLGEAVGNVQASINDNIAIVNEKVAAEQSKYEFELNQKNRILDRVIQAQGNLLSDQQKKDLEATKFANSLELDQQRINLETKKSLLIEAAKRGINISEFNNLGDVDINTLMSRTTPPANYTDVMTNDPNVLSTLTPGQWKARDALLSATSESEKERAQREMMNQTGAATAEGMINIITALLSPENAQGLKDSVGVNVFGRIDWKAGANSTAFRALSQQLVSEGTLKRLTDLKAMGGTLGALSDNEGRMLESASSGGLGIHKGGGKWAANEETFIRNLEVLNMANMKLYVASNTGEAWDNSGLKALEYDTVIGYRDDGSPITGYDFMTQRYKETKFNILNQKPVELYNIRGELMSQEAPEVDFDKLIAIESGGSYTAVNPTSGAFGKYQFIPSTLKQYADRLGLTEDQAKTPEGQERMFATFTQDNMNGLKKAGIPITTASVYLAHQQGLGGAQQILKGDISPTVRRNLLANLPDRYKDGTDDDVINGWFDVFLPKLA